MRKDAAWLLAPLLLVSLLLPGCRTPVGVERPGTDTVYARLRANAITRGIPSGTTRTVLDRHDLWSTWNRRMPEALDRLLDIAVGDPRRDTVFALAELHYLAFLDGWGEEHALAAAAFAWTYLFDESVDGSPNPWEDTVRAAGDLYNRSLLEALRIQRGESLVSVVEGERDLPRGTMGITLENGLGESLEGLTLIAADDFAVRGLRVRNRRTGLGVRLVAALPRPEVPILERGVFRGRVPFAATALLVPGEGLQGLVRGRLEGTLRLVDPLKVRTLTVGGVRFPVASDGTLPLAWALERSSLWSMEKSAFFSGEADLPPGLALLENSPGLVPVVFVHGTASSPGRWAEMINTLEADPEIRDRFQFWVFLYPTGNPVPYSAAQLRESLADALAELDPGGTDPLLRRVVLVGHSQGGLLCRMVASSSPTGEFRTADGKTLEEITSDETARALVRRCLEFEAAPSVSRAIFLASPHRGSFFAGNWISRLINSFISVTRTIQGAVAERLTGKGEGEVTLPRDFHLPTAVDNMAPGSPFLDFYEEMVPGPGVRFHSIVAVDGEGGPEGLDDGIVAYESAHLPDAASEFVVRSGHSCQAHPLVIEEVRRILLEHLRELDGEAQAPAPSR